MVNFRKAYSWVKNKVVAPIYGGVKKVHSWIDKGWKWVDNALNNAKSVPIIGELASLLKDNPLYNEIGSLIGTSGQIINDAGQVGGYIDKIVGGDQYGDEQMSKINDARSNIMKIVNAVATHRVGGNMTPGSVSQSGATFIPTTRQNQVASSDAGKTMMSNAATEYGSGMTKTPTMNTGYSTLPTAGYSAGMNIKA